jgi:nucleoside-diphosphate-sugar epimerase
MTYLVLGSAGLIGSALARILQKAGHRVLGMDIVHCAKEDLRIPDNGILDHYLSLADFAFFLAFDVGGSRYLSKYQQTYDFVSNNVRLMEATFAQLKKHETPFLFSSSQMSNMGYSSYGALKSVGEHYTRVLGGLVVKFWNVYGVEPNLEKAHVITDFICRARERRVIDMMTDGAEERQFLYVDDCCEALLALSASYSSIPRERELHVTSFEWTSIRVVADLVASQFPGTRVVPGRSPDRVQLGRRNEPDPYVRTFWQPRTPLAEGIARAAASSASALADG